MKLISNILLFSLFMFSSSCDLLKNAVNNTDDSSTNAKVINGEASYYADKFHGRKTASGEVYNKNKLTAAHKTMAFGTKVQVKNLKNGKTVQVKINDRLPSTSKRVIDLSREAARQLGMIQDGVVQVEIRVLN